MKTLIATAAVALTLSVAASTYASPNRGTELARGLHDLVQRPAAYALTGDAAPRRTAVTPDRYPVQRELRHGRGAF